MVWLLWFKDIMKTKLIAEKILGTQALLPKDFDMFSQDFENVSVIAY